jgi:anti-anti-sigma regulatory factor
VDDKDQQSSEQPTNTAVRAERVSRSETVVNVVGALRDEVTAELRRSVVSGLRDSQEVLVLDLSAVTDIDDDGVDVLETAAAMAGEKDIFFCLVLPPESPVLTALGEAELSALFEVFYSVTEALKKAST